MMSISVSKDNDDETKFNPPFDFLRNRSRTSGARYLKECSVKLRTNVLTTAIAATYYHKFFDLVSFKDYDCYLIACTCIHLASKVNDDDLKIRDIINVGYNTVHHKDTPLSLDPYFELRDSLVDCELLLMRMLNYNLKIDLPHRYMLFYLNSIKHWMNDKIFKEIPIVSVCWTILNDVYLSPLLTKYSPHVIATSVINIVTEIYGINIKYRNREKSVIDPWFMSMHSECTIENVKQVTGCIIDMYKREETLQSLEEAIKKSS